MGQLVAVAVVCSILGYVWGYLHAVRDLYRKGNVPAPGEVSPAEPVVDTPRGFRDFQLFNFSRGRYELMFSLDMEDLAPDERAIVAHDVTVSPGGAVTLGLRCNVDESDEVPF